LLSRQGCWRNQLKKQLVAILRFFRETILKIAQRRQIQLFEPPQEASFGFAAELFLEWSKKYHEQKLFF
jgi:hypothetical protein